MPLVTLGIYAPRRHLDPPSQAGLGALTTRASVRGAGPLDAGGLAFAFEGLGGSLASSTATDWVGFNTTILADHLGEAAELLGLVFWEPTLDDDSVALERGVAGGRSGPGDGRHVPLSLPARFRRGVR